MAQKTDSTLATGLPDDPGEVERSCNCCNKGECCECCCDHQCCQKGECCECCCSTDDGCSECCAKCWKGCGKCCCATCDGCMKCLGTVINEDCCDCFCQILFGFCSGDD